MSEALVAVLVALVVVVVAALVAWPMVRRQRLRSRFGPEYDRAVEETENRRAAERELIARERRHADLELRELSAEQKQRYTEQWAGVQEQFIDNPQGAMTTADRLVTVIMAERGYPTEGYDQQVADLSVEHATTLDHYRTAHDIATRPDSSAVSTEDMRTAIVHYRALFVDLLNGHGDTAAHDGDKATARHQKDTQS